MFNAKFRMDGCTYLQIGVDLQLPDRFESRPYVAMVLEREAMSAPNTSDGTAREAAIMDAATARIDFCGGGPNGIAARDRKRCDDPAMLLSPASWCSACLLRHALRIQRENPPAQYTVIGVLSASHARAVASALLSAATEAKG